ncbi:HET-domain-containing protein [Stemphylium lycopersici]|nr:HET-domain-containing protein [Stemphylium lycopersici]
MSELEASSGSCPLCSTIFTHMKDSYHYHKNFPKHDERPLWLKVNVGLPIWGIYIGEEKPEVRVSGIYGYTTTPDSVVADCFIIHSVIEDSLDPFVLRKMQDWVQECDDTHSGCHVASGAARLLPTRLLDLGSLPHGKAFDGMQGDPQSLLNDTSFRLVETNPNEEGVYVALSYCWGQYLAYKTTHSNLRQHTTQGGIRYADLPKTLQDAVFLVRYLGIRYIWADCLCIIQDDAGDWEHEASRMADVYSNAYLTISAARANHCGEGFLNPRKTKDRNIVPFTTEQGSFDLDFGYNDLTMSPGHIESVVETPLSIRREEPLLNRVWCLQERVLATRTLHFASQQMYWECSAHFKTEVGDTLDHKSCPEYSLDRVAAGLNSVKQAPMLKLPVHAHEIKETWAVNTDWRVWFRLVQAYTSRNMTYQTDKLPALSGVISALQKLTGDTCLAGIWKSWFLKGLLWRLQDPEWDLYVFDGKTPCRPAAWRAPSWSFASVEGVVVYAILEIDYGNGLCAELLECSLTPKSSKNPLGELVSGFAKIKAPVVQVSKIAKEQSYTGRDCMVHMGENQVTEAGVYFDVECYDSCEVLMITPHTGIAVVPVHGRDSMTYSRVGAVEVYRIFDPKGPGGKDDGPASTNRDKFLSIADWPEPSVVFLL